MLPSLLEILAFAGCYVGVALIRHQRLLIGWVVTGCVGVSCLLAAWLGGPRAPASFAALGLIAIALRMGVARHGSPRGFAVLAAGAAMLLLLPSLAQP